MFTERELQLILSMLEDNYHGLVAEIIRCQIDLGRDATSLNVKREEVEALIDKVSDLYLEV